LFLYQSLINYYKSGSYEVTDKAKVLAKVAKVVNDKPDFECMVEGHMIIYIGTEFY
jgi:chemotaxis protein MotB